MVVIDAKWTSDFDGYGVVSHEPEAILYHPRVVWKVRPGQIRARDPLGRGPFARGLRYLFEQRGDPRWRPGQPGAVTVLVDELALVAPVAHVHEGIEMLILAGRGRGIGVWGGSQEPYKVYSAAFSQAIHIFAFHLANRMHRAKLESDLEGESLPPLESLPPRQFFHHQQGAGWSGPWEL